MNLSGFKKTAENKSTVTMTHANGHEIKIAKSALSALQKKQIERLPIHLDEGTDGPLDTAEDEQTQSEASPASFGIKLPDADTSVLQPSSSLVSFDQTPEQADIAEAKTSDQLPSVEVPKGELPAPATDLPGQGTPVGSDEAAKPAQAATNLPKVSGPGDQFNKYYQGAQHAIDSQKNLDSQIAAQKAETGEARILAEKQINAETAQNFQDYTQHVKQFQDYISNNPIDPRHYQENLGTGAKVATAIGLLLGGFQGGFNGTGKNPAQEFLNAQIDRDLKAQEGRMDQQKTILGANMDLYKNREIALNASRVNMNQIYDQQIQLAADKLGTEQAKNVAAQNHLKLAGENNTLLQENAQRSAALKSIETGGVGLNPITLSKLGYLKPEEAIKEQASIDSQKSSINDLQSLYAAAGNEASLGNILSPASYTRLQTINAGIADKILKADTNHRINEQTKSIFIDPYLIHTGDVIKGTVNTKLQGALDKIQDLSSGSTPVTAHYAPGALPIYPKVASLSGGPAPAQFKVGDIVYKNGVKAQVLPGGKLKAVK